MGYRLFITASFKGDLNKKAIESLCGIVDNAGFESFCFIRDVENYKPIFDSDKKLMISATSEIAKSDALLLQIDGSPTGRLIEAGIAYALNKPIITISTDDVPLKKTVKGITTIFIKYHSNEELEKELAKAHRYFIEQNQSRSSKDQ